MADGQGAGDDAELVRIGELSRRVGVSDHTLRAWEARYGLLRPHRTPGGFRLYSRHDEARVRQMSRLIERGLSSAQAAQLVLSGVDSSALEPTGPAVHHDPPAASSRVIDTSSAVDPTAVAGMVAQASSSRPRPLERFRELLMQCLDRYDEAGAHAVLDRLLAEFALETVLRDGILPMLREQGERWRRGDITVVQEHFATNVVRGRLAGLARGWASGTGPVAVVACPNGEQHDLASMVFGIALHECGWRVIFLGANTPIDQLVGALDRAPALVVISTIDPKLIRANVAALGALSGWAPVALAGRGASAEVAAAVGAVYLGDDPVTEAFNVAHRRYGQATSTQ